MPSLYAFVLTLRQGYHDEQRCYLRLVKRGMVVFDVGANFGHYTLLYSNLVGSVGNVHAFEPVPRSAEQLRNRIESEGVYDNVSLDVAAVTDQSGIELQIGIPNGDFGQASLTPHATGSWSRNDNIEYVKCATITLDDFVREQKIGAVDFITIDVEGAE